MEREHDLEKRAMRKFLEWAMHAPAGDVDTLMHALKSGWKRPVLTLHPEQKTCEGCVYEVFQQIKDHDEPGPPYYAWRCIARDAITRSTRTFGLTSRDRLYFRPAACFLYERKEKKDV